MKGKKARGSIASIVVGVGLLAASLAIPPPAHAAPSPMCSGRRATAVGTDHADVLEGTSHSDVIVGRGGNDRIFGRGGQDVICGGGGNDKLYGHRGDDLLDGGGGTDSCYQGPGSGKKRSCEGPSFPLTVSAAGSGEGAVSSAPNGIECGSDCSQEYAEGTEVSLTAVASAGSTFTGWNGSCSGTDQCTVRMGGPRSIAATFSAQAPPPGTPSLPSLPQLPPVVLTLNLLGSGSGFISSIPAGIDCGSICSFGFAPESSVVLTAVPAIGSTLSGWSGCDVAVGNVCTVAMSSAATVTATFTLAFDLTITRDGNRSGHVASVPAGIDCGSDCVESYNVGTVVALTAVPDTGTTLPDWTGCDSVLGGVCTVTMNSAKDVTATFTLLTFDLTVDLEGSGDGWVTGSPIGINCGIDCIAPYDYGTVVILTPNPDIGSAFTGWSGACTGTAACAVTMNSAKDVTATFTRVFNLTVNRTGGGAGTITSTPSGVTCGSDCVEAFEIGTVVTLLATPGANSLFSGWSGAGCSGVGSCVVTMNAVKSVTATFTQTFTLTVSTDGGGSVTSLPAGITCGVDCSEAYAEDSLVTLTASPDLSHVFVGWGGACSGIIIPTCVVLMSTTRSVMATFAQTFTLSVSTNGAGSVTSLPAGINCGGDCSEAYAEGSLVTLTAIPDPLHVFVAWGGDCSGTFIPTCVVTMSQARSVTATFL